MTERPLICMCGQSPEAWEAKLDKARAVEREACAVIAIEHADFCRKEFYSGGHESLDERSSGAAWIAELIRRRS